MWNSIGDKYDVSRHDDQKRPRKFKSNPIILILLLLCFVVSTFRFYALTDGTWIGRYLPIIVYCISAVLCAVMLLLKWKRNEKEFDILLFVSFLCFLLFVYLFL